MKVAIFKTNFLGDNVVFLPVVQALRRRFPDWRLTLVTDARVAPLYAADIDSTDILTIAPDEMKRLWRRPAAFLRWRTRLRRRAFDASLVSYDQSSSAHALAWLAGGRVRVGGSGLRIRLQRTLTDGVAWREGWSIAQWNWEIARALAARLGGHDWPEKPPAPDLSHFISSAEGHSRRIVIHAGSKWEHTRWPLERYVELASRLAHTHEVVWINTPETRHATLPAGVIAVESPDVNVLASWVANAALFIGNNSGPMHVANAAGTPIVVVAGPSATTWDPNWHQERVRVLRQPGLACQPCEHVHFMPNGCTNLHEPLACLRRWSVEAVERISREVLSQTESS